GLAIAFIEHREGRIELGLGLALRLLVDVFELLRAGPIWVALRRGGDLTPISSRRVFAPLSCPSIAGIAGIAGIAQLSVGTAATTATPAAALPTPAGIGARVQAIRLRGLLVDRLR